jgi:ATP/maltotriose-dependent transcriptional regulator MalT
MAEGLTNVEISQTLSISQHTAKSHVIHIFNKLGVNNRTQASVLASLRNLIPREDIS